MAKKRYAQVGLGGRSGMYTRALEGAYAESSELVGLCDSNEGRLRNRLERVKANIPGCPAKAYAAEDFDRMVEETKPDVVIVTTKDSFAGTATRRTRAD